MKQRELLIASSELDCRFQQNALAPAEYHRRRDGLKAELLRLRMETAIALADEA